ncbi:MAG: hypothetical protein EA395_00200 [Phormidium sp. GEM2.Bin31]|nr:MAG: hypothetical protein EA395_00200 [Phormidium sp. GEM2.Bin31]
MTCAPECPRCGKSSIVQQGNSRWTCLNCGFSKNLSHHHDHLHDSDEVHQDEGWFSIVILAGILVMVIVYVIDGQNRLQQRRDVSTSATTLEQLNQP